MRKGRKYNHQAIMQDHENGLSVKQLREKYGIEEKWCRELLVRQGIFRRLKHKDWTNQELLDKIRELVEKYGFISSSLLCWEGNLVEALRLRGLLSYVKKNFPYQKKPVSERGIAVEELAYTTILPQESFTDILWLRKEGYFILPFSFIARRNSTSAIIDVTAVKYSQGSHQKRREQLCVKIASILEADYYLLRIHPAGERYILEKKDAFSLIRNHILNKTKITT